MRFINTKRVFLAIGLVFASHAYATTYQLPSRYESLIGQKFYLLASGNEKFRDLTRHYDLGTNALENANPHLNIRESLPTGAPIQIPTQHLLPNETRSGIVINLPEMRLYYYPEGSQVVLTYPIGIGKIGKTIPIERARITRKMKDPVWIPPDDIRQFNLDHGIVLPKIMPAGPDNPLGPYAIYMTIPSYLIHSTPFPDSIGKRASFGCIRMYEWDIKDFFPTVRSGVPIAIINSPTKVGWQDDRLYMEAHKPLAEHDDAYEATLPGMVHILTNISQMKMKTRATLIDWQLVSFIAQIRDGVPHEIGIKLK